MKTYILFREGLSGHYLKSVLSGEVVEGKFRMDPWWPGIYEKRHDLIDLTQDFHCGHKVSHHPFDLTLTILVREKIYHGIYNNFYKKLLVEMHTPEEFADWKNNLIFWYDRAYYNIKEYYSILQNDVATNQNPNVVEFDRMLDPEYLNEISLKYYNKPLSDYSKSLVLDYASKQLDIELTTNGSSMEEIVAAIPDDRFADSPWFASYAIFKFEKNNNLSEHSREWSIDEITQPIDREFLCSIAQRYSAIPA